mmetsp:Transcript_29231/g.83737  ORF Transcript_29231/g.83737 Transcript_29231/m.83737 type:complete len:369 (+) Transcript_29231:93-1199(+)
MPQQRLVRRPLPRGMLVVAALGAAAISATWQSLTSVQSCTNARVNPATGLQRRCALLGVGPALLPGKAAQAEARVLAPATGKISGGALPLTVGLGTCLVSSSAVVSQVAAGLSAGYRLIDTAQRYGNEAGIGRALSEAFLGGLPREEVFVTTKVWPANYGYDKAIKSVRDSAAKLGLESIDLVLPHWPGVGTSIEQASDNFRLRQETWRALETLKKEGVAKQIGVSNYNGRHLQELLGYAEIRPMASQFEIHPFNARSKLVELCQSEGICVNGYSPLGGKGNPGAVTDKLLSSPVLTRIASAHGKTPAQVILRWHLQRGVTPIPKASTPARLQENYNVFDFSLSDDEMGEITALDRKKFAVMDSEVFL